MVDSRLPDNIRCAFTKRPDLKQKIENVFPALLSEKKLPDTVGEVFLEIADYVLDLRRQIEGATEDDAKSNGLTTKKRKLNDSASPNLQEGGASINGPWRAAEIFERISFSVPQRKKLNLQISSNRKSEGIRATAPNSSNPEFGIPWPEVEHVICLPVPEKAQPQRNFCVFPKAGDGITPVPEGGNQYETMVWAAADTRPKGAAEEEHTQTQKIIERLTSAKCTPQQPDEKEFVSAIAPAGRKGEKAYHVKGFKGNKDGYLFFLPHGILWGFKKPLTLFSFPVIDSISYTSILQRTFNLVISARSSADSAPQDHEFSMLDQADFAGIDAYIKRHGLQDASLAEARRAKKYNVNGVKKEDGEGGEEEDGEGELAKAHKEAEMRADDDEDDEEDENFDPGTEGESEGSGTSDEEDEEEDEGGGGGEGNSDAEEDEEMEDESDE